MGNSRRFRFALKIVGLLFQNVHLFRVIVQNLSDFGVFLGHLGINGRIRLNPFLGCAEHRRLVGFDNFFLPQSFQCGGGFFQFRLFGHHQAFLLVFPFNPFSFLFLFAGLFFLLGFQSLCLDRGNFVLNSFFFQFQIE